MKQFDELISITKTLRNPIGGCPWDIKQTSLSLLTNFTEEFYEVLEAFEKGDSKDICEELGDLLLHIVFQAQIGSENGTFSIKEILERINKKLISRHPHVFGKTKAKDANSAKNSWEKSKQKEKKKERNSVLDGVPKRMPATLVAKRIQEKAASVGFDWEKSTDIFLKIQEELDELITEHKKGNTKNQEKELGDLLFSVINFARKLDIDPESTLKKTIKKFENRFHYIEKYHKKNKLDIYKTSLEEKDKLWQEAKKNESFNSTSNV